jgi:hypothetical protein
MHKAILFAVGLAFIANTAQAQSSRRYDTDDDDSRAGRREWRDIRNHDDDDDEGWRRSDQVRGSKGARFMLRSGDTAVRVACDSRDSLRSCVDAALMLFDKLRQAGPASGTSNSPGSTTPSPTQRP